MIVARSYPGLLEAALIGALFSCAVACGDDSSAAAAGGNGGSSGAAGAGAGGSAGLDAGMSGAGTGGSSMGPDGGAGAVAGASSQGGSGGLPPDCPLPTPIPVAGQVIAIQSVNVDTSEIVLRNVSRTNQSIQIGRQGWQWCSYPRYWAILDEEAVRVLAPGEILPFIAINNTSGVAPFFAGEGELAMYPQTGVFEEYEFMQAFVAWGEVQAFRESYAVQKGLWAYEERIQIRSGHAGFIATGPTNRAAGYTSVRAACLVVAPNL